MSVDQAASRRSERSRDGSKVVRYHDYIDEKIEGTRQMVKVVDLATALVELAVAVLLFLLFAVVVEHWVVPGGLPAPVRAVLFLLLVTGVGFFLVRRLWPLCVRGINPVYAAHAIELGSPTLKNGLVNLLLFRQRRTEISDAVYHTLEEQAAHGLTRVPVDTTVDRTELIRLGYLLIAIVAVVAAYKIFSPKDPLVAAERVLMPWADIVPASRVTFSEIKPGTDTVSQGETVDVSAAVHGLTENDTVTLRYTTEDGQIVSRGIPMKASRDGLQYVARLADESERGVISGVTRNLKYRIEAGDARSLEYTLTVVPAATIVIERVDYHYPAYTGYLDRSAEGVGDIQAIEGTKITIHARANGVIREANVDFDADGRPDLQMNAQDNKAHVSFELGLREDRQTPLHASYVLRFANTEGRANHDPVKYSINVKPDQQPEVELRTPEEKSRDAQPNESVAIEIGARDPDFSLATVRLRGEVAGREVLNEAMLKGEHKGQFNGRYALVPSAHELKEGDVLEYWAEAEDNRAPKPNVVSTEHKALRIVSMKQGAQARSNQSEQNGEKQPQQGDKGHGKGQQNGGQKGNDQGGDSGQQKPDGQGGQGQSKDGQGEGQGQKGNEKGRGGNPQPGQSGGEQQSGDGDQKQSGDLKQNQTGSGKSDHANDHGGQGQSEGGGGQSVSNDPSSSKPDQQQQADKQNGAGASGSEQSKDGAKPNGDKGKNKDGGQHQSGQQQKGQQKNGQQGDQQSNESQPVSSEGDDDGEAFNRIQKRMEQSGELKPNEGSKKDDVQGDKPQQGGAKDSGQQKTASEQQGQSGDDKQGVDKAGAKSQDGKSVDKADSQQDGSEQGAKGKGSDSQQTDSKQQGKQQGKQQSDPQQKQQPPSGGQNSSNGSPTAANDDKQQGAPNSKPGMKPTDKPDQSGPKNNKNDGREPASGASDKRESDSHADQGGDKAGGGAEGGGQKSPHDGTGSAGENQSADSGAGKSGEKGKGDTSSAGGKDVKSDHPTGSSDGKTPGQGSGQKDGAGDKPGGQSGEKKDAAGDKSTPDGAGQKNEQGADQQGSKQHGDKADGQNSEKKDASGEKPSPDGAGQNNEQGSKQQGDKAGQKSDSNQGNKQQADKSTDKNAGERSNDQGKQDSDQPNAGNDAGSNRGGSSGSGEPGAGVNPQVSITGEAPEGDAANLEYARKQTDLVVGKLADQLNSKKVDPALLKELGWSQEDLKRFVERWQKRKEAAEQTSDAGDAAKRELEDALRSLGLRPGEMRQNAVQKDTMRDLHEAYRGPVPAEYKDRLRAYNQGVSRAKKDGE